MASRDDQPQTGSRRGRPRAGEAERRREAVLDAASAVLIERGYRGMTMGAVAERAGASKETLYAWFGGKEGLVAALVGRNADAMNDRVAAAFDDDADMRTTLVQFAEDLLELLLGERSIALNRAAMAELHAAPALAEVLLANGRHRTGPLVVAYLERQRDLGRLRFDDPREAFTTLYGLIMRDAQIRTLLGEPAPPAAQRRQRAAAAVDAFLRLHGT